MARFVRQSDSEPLMRIERPSTASSQTTAHIINSCFNEILCHKPLDTKGINNLAVSKRELNECEFQSYYVDKLKRISDECNQCLDELSEVERHLMEARAKALAEDETTISDLVAHCPTYKETGLPSGRSQLRKYLDEELLIRHKLLAPSRYIPQDTRVASPPCGGTPSFMQATESSSQHATVSPRKTQISPRSHTEVCKHPWQECINASEREAEKRALAELNRKTDYLKNPRYSSGFCNTASYGPLKKNGKDLDTQSSNSFIIDPSEVMFTVYEPGGTYKLVVEFRNVSGTSRQLRLIPVKSPYFSVSRGYFPTEDGLIAPGMKCSFIVTFTPDSLASYRETMKVLTSNGEYLVVPLIGMRPPPMLSLPRTLECGSCLMGDSKTWSIVCENSGGEGSFKWIARTDGSGKEEEEEEKTQKDLDSVSLGSFVISPRNFHIPASGGRVNIQVVFTPTDMGQFSEDISMACDNGQVLEFTITGVAEKVCVGCVHIRTSSAKERLSFNPSSSMSKAYAIRAALASSVSSFRDVPLSEIMESPCIDFSGVNPHNSLFQTILIHNFCNVDLPYIWKNYRPLTKDFNDDLKNKEKVGEESEHSHVDSLVPTKHSPFSIYPNQGTLHSGTTFPFTVRFNPEKVGSFTDMGYLVLTNKIKDAALDCSSRGTGWLRMADSSLSVVCLQMQGICDAYRIELNPPAVLIPGKIPISTHVKRKLTITNHSHCTAQLKWSSYGGNNKSITVNPRHGKIVSGGSSVYEVAVLGHSEGVLSTTLHCSVDASSPDFPLYVRGNVQGPVISLDSGHLNFGLVAFGRCASLKTSLRNGSNCSINYTLQQVVQDREGTSFMDHPCLSFSPAEGSLLPHSSTTITVQCRPKETGRFRSTMELIIDGNTNQSVSVEAEVQRPQLYLTSSQLHFDEAYVGMSTMVDVSLRNGSLVPAHFTWSNLVFGSNRKYCKVNVRTMTGRVDSNQEITIPIEVTWSAEGSFDLVFLNCVVLDMEQPLVLSLSANVKGLSVIYKLLSIPHQTRNESVDGAPGSISFSSSDESDDIPLPQHKEKYLLDFGEDNEIGRPIRMSLKVINTSDIPTSIETVISYFPAAKLPTPPHHPKTPDVPNVGTGGKYLLRKTSNIIKLQNKNAGQESAEYIASLLRDDRGVCFVVEPSSADLPAFGSVILKVTAYSDMWGNYHDHLTCKVKGLKDDVIVINFGVVGSPIQFVTTASSAQTLVRFGSHPSGTKRIRRSLKVKNCGPMDLRINWKTFSILKDDDKFFDLITTYGDPYPLTKNILASSTYHQNTPSVDDATKNRINPTSDVGISITQEDGSILTDILNESAITNSSVEFPVPDLKQMDHVDVYVEGERLKSLDSHLQIDDGADGREDFIRVNLKMHEGVESNDPFDIHPKQTLISARGSAMVEVTYLSTRKTFLDMGAALYGYAVGNVGIDGPTPPHVTRKTGYDTKPIRIEMMAGIEKIELSLECEDSKEGLHFRCPASLLLQDNMEVRPEVSQVQNCTLINTSNTALQFDFCTSSSYFFVDDIRTAPILTKSSTMDVTHASPMGLVTIGPQSSLQFSLRFSFTPSDISELRSRPKDSADSSEGLYEGKLRITFQNGTTQEFPLSAVIKLPVLTLSKVEHAMGLCHLGKSLSSSLNLTNISLSSAIWTTTISQELEDVVSVSPQSGTLQPHLQDGRPSTQTIHITFSPKCEASYDGIVILKEILTGKKWKISISGVGSADEQNQNI